MTKTDKVNESPQNRLWRTVIRIESAVDDEITLVVLGFGRIEIVYGSEELNLPDGFEEFLFFKAKFPYRCHAKVNFGADTVKDLVFKDWEWEEK